MDEKNDINENMILRLLLRNSSIMGTSNNWIFGK
jgi:hypothetical protein